MRRITHEDVFVLLVFGLIYVILTSNAEITGSAIQANNGHGLESVTPAIMIASDDGKITYDISIIKNLDQTLTELENDNNIIIRKGKDSYQMTVIRVTQDYASGIESLTFLVSPGDKRISLTEKQMKEIDFNNDGISDLNVRLDAIAYGKATASFSAN